MNHKAQELIQKELQNYPKNHLILDLFGGSGNLTQAKAYQVSLLTFTPKTKLQVIKNF